MVYPTLELEDKLWSLGYKNVVGVDEAGRGPLAGPVVAGAVLVHGKDQMVEGVRDSKKMSEKQRASTFEQIMEKSSGWGVGIVSSEEIDEIGIQEAVRQAMIRAISSIKEIDYIIADGKNVSPIVGYKMDRITKGDMLHYSISAGSILAKVTRDRLMKELALEFPQYGFDKHMGYGTKNHISAIMEFGPCNIHRKSFEPIKSLLINNSLS